MPLTKWEVDLLWQTPVESYDPFDLLRRYEKRIRIPVPRRVKFPLFDIGKDCDISLKDIKSSRFDLIDRRIRQYWTNMPKEMLVSLESWFGNFSPELKEVGRICV